MSLPQNGLYRTTQAHPSVPSLGSGRLAYVGRNRSGAFVVAPHFNEKNRWYWREPVTPLVDDAWAASLKRLPSEGFYTLPRTLEFSGGGRWLQNAIVQLGYDRTGRGILFVAERHEASEQNALLFSERGHKIDDELLEQLRWAPVLPVKTPPRESLH